MKLNAIGVCSSNLPKTLDFYKLLGFQFPELTDQKHIESTPPEPVKLMIDKKETIEGILGVPPIPSNHSTFALEFNSPEELNQIAAKIKEAGFKIIKEPWDAFWKQRYAILEDPDGYKVDLYAAL